MSKLLRTLTILLLSVAALQAPASLQAQAPKPPLHGLVTMGSIGPLFTRGAHADNSLKEANAHPGVYVGALILVSWDELEHNRGKLDSSAIDKGLVAVRAYNKKYPATPLKAKLRIFMGWNTPAWVVAESGGAVLINPPTAQARRGDTEIGRFWTESYQQAWRGLQALLAAKYDDDPLLGEVAVSSCATITAEPFIQAFQPDNIKRMHDAGFTDAGFKSCLMGVIEDYAAWKHTPIDYTVNPFRTTDSGKPSSHPEVTEEILVAFRAKYGSRGVIANHGLDAPLLDREVETFAALKKLGPPIEFQTLSPKVDWDGSVAIGLSCPATEIEVWDTKAAGGPTDVSIDQLRKWAAQFAAQPASILPPTPK